MLKLKFKNKQQGFTIVELLIVIVVIGILAAITIVAYNNVNDKARASSAVSALDQAKKKLELYKAENDGYPADLITIGISDSPSVAYEYTSSANTDYCLTATVSNISYYLNNSTKTSPTEGGCNNHTWPGGVAMTNLVTNGDFSNGTSGWVSQPGYNLTAVDGVMSQTVITTGSAVDRLHGNNMVVVSGNKYYISIEINPFRSHTPRLYIGTVTVYPPPTASVGTFSNVSSVIVASGTDRLHLYANGGWTSGVDVVAGATTKYKNILVINLTTTFGAGNEPTKEQMDQIMEQFPNSWFNGTVTANTKGVL